MNPRPITTTTPLDDDDVPIGRILSRREVLALFGYGGVVLAAAACAPNGGSGGAGSGIATSGSTAGTSPGAVASADSGVPACVAVPELTEGPYYAEDALERSDIRTDSADGSTVEGVPLTLG